MGQLAGFTYRTATRKLRNLGFRFDRSAKGSHELWFNKETRMRTTIPNHPGDIPEGTMRAIITQAGIAVEDFLNA
ncbi:MAG TPA: type II toxin-antitoxin system HicA family toxin [Spirochaetia bacterium]|nr:type II toxin-antitoxin system HicA family toxin [Synergistaceae bacterium]HRW25646.1 type II toxin-antitoxin system HicA family toxin [Spirochaetia bacterium]